ncbi:hypothetical protein N9414_08934 [Nodularia spumigena CCY9414]|nr:hypothetical protein N9414_08934 [Nodularia spumigena CCY9414]
MQPAFTAVYVSITFQNQIQLILQKSYDWEDLDALSI